MSSRGGHRAGAKSRAEGAGERAARGVGDDPGEQGGLRSNEVDEIGAAARGGNGPRPETIRGGAEQDRERAREPAAPAREEARAERREEQVGRREQGRHV